MKTFITLIVSAFFITSCSLDEPAFVEYEQSTALESIIKTPLYDSNNVLISTAYLKSKWEKELAKEGNSVRLDQFEVITSNTDEGFKTYFLKARSVDGNIETGAFMVKKSGGSGEGYLLRGKTCTCTSSQCSSGCSLSVNGNRCYCSPCGGMMGGECVKTETITIGDK